LNDQFSPWKTAHSARSSPERSPVYIIDEDDSLIAFLPLEHHPLIVPKKHLQDIFALDNETAALIAQRSIRIAKAMRNAAL
jgi:histidine triad (HIT) family protein